MSPDSGLTHRVVQEGAILTEIPEQGFFTWVKEQMDAIENGCCPECGTPGVKVSVHVPIKMIDIQCTEETCPHYNSEVTGATGPGATVEQLRRSDEIVATLQLAARPNVETATIRRVRMRERR